MPASTDVEVFTKHAVERSVHVPWFLVDSKWHHTKPNLCSITSILHRSSHQRFVLSTIPKRHFPPSSPYPVLRPTYSPLSGLDTRLTTALEKFGSNRCKLNVNLYRSGVIMETTTWFNIWTAGVAINEICIKRGMLGTAYSLG